jgi:hypothetical protein
VPNYYRTLAARGLTPNYKGARFGQFGEVFGKIGYFEHWPELTVVGVKCPDGLIREFDFDHLEEVDVWA